MDDIGYSSLPMDFFSAFPFPDRCPGRLTPVNFSLTSWLGVEFSYRPQGQAGGEGRSVFSDVLSALPSSSGGGCDLRGHSTPLPTPSQLRLSLSCGQHGFFLSSRQETFTLRIYLTKWKYSFHLAPALLVAATSIIAVLRASTFHVCSLNRVIPQE